MEITVETVNWFYVLSLFSGLMGVITGSFLTSWFTSKRNREHRKIAFIEKQLSEFYSVMLGLQQEIRINSELGEKLSSAASSAWNAYSAAHKGPQFQDQNNNELQKYKAIISYDNEKLQNQLIPAYNKMLNLFRDKLWLADEETRVFYPTLFEFVEIWNRHLQGSIPFEVIKIMKHTEQNLHPFYHHLQNQRNKLHDLLKQGGV